MPEMKENFILEGGTGREFAAIIHPTSESGEIAKRAIVCYRKHDQAGRFIQSSNDLYFPLHYVLTNPSGTNGWDYEYRKENKKC